MWIFELTQTYRPGNRIVKDSCLIVYDLDPVATQNVKTIMHIDFEDESFNGEGRHPTNVIVKENEPGAYGLGKMRQQITNKHTTTRYATRKEVAKALGLKEREVDAYRPPNTSSW